MSGPIFLVNLRTPLGPITGTVTCEFTPNPPVVKTITAHPLVGNGRGPSMAIRSVTIQLAPPVDPSVTSIPFVVLGSTVAGQNPVTVDAFVATNFFQANDGDQISMTGTQINSAGTGPASLPVYATIAAGVLPVSPTPPPPPPALPVAPVVATLTAT